MAPHPEYDPTGKTVLVSWTEAPTGTIQLRRIHWK
jgi:hypothetical protein